MSAQLLSPQAAAAWLQARVNADLTTNSRQVGMGDGFIAWPGAAVDARQFVGKALAAGASALVKRQTERKAAQKAAAAAAPKKMVQADGEWTGDDFVKQSNALAR